jgi:hypothetical protein
LTVSCRQISYFVFSFQHTTWPNMSWRLSRSSNAPTDPAVFSSRLTLHSPPVVQRCHPFTVLNSWQAILFPVLSWFFKLVHLSNVAASSSKYLLIHTLHLPCCPPSLLHYSEPNLASSLPAVPRSHIRRRWVSGHCIEKADKDPSQPDALILSRLFNVLQLSESHSLTLQL